MNRRHARTSAPIELVGRRRWLAVCLCACVPDPLAGSGGIAMVELWVELSEPVPATARSSADATRRAEQVAQQQRRVADELRALGAIEFARVRHVRNAIAVRCPEDRLDAVREIPGVLHLRPTKGLRPPETMPAASAPRTQPR